MLIKCPECNKEISDKPSVCIHCGYPLSNSKPEQQKEQLYDVSLTAYTKGKSGSIASALIGLYGAKDLGMYWDIIDNLSTIKSNITLEEANKIKSAIEKVGGKVSITKADSNAVEYNTDQHRASLNVPYCPKCGSTSITTGARGVDGFWGFFGASRTVNRCANCGHSWEPRG